MLVSLTKINEQKIFSFFMRMIRHILIMKKIVPLLIILSDHF